MRLSAVDPPSWQRIATKIIPHISNLDGLREHLSKGALLIAFDSESYGYPLKKGRSRPSGERSELGFAALEWPCPDLKICYSSKEFAFQNHAKLLNIQLHQRSSKYIESTSSPTVHANGVEEAQQAIRRFLPPSSKRILVGYALSTEFRWMAMNFLALAESFIAWVDVQELVMQQCIGDAPFPIDAPLKDISLRAALYAMNFCKSSKASKAHRAVNDACRALQVLAGLLTSHTFALMPLSGQTLVCLQPSGWIKKRFAITLCIIASEGNALPRRNLEQLAQMYQVFEPVAVGIYHYIGGNGKKKNKQYWWLAFQDEEALTTCKADV